MKKFINKIIGKLCSIDKDKYQHFTLGAIIASIIYMVCLILGVRFDLSFIASIFVTFIAEWVKEFILDGSADLKDFAVTMLGGAIVWGPILLTYLCF